MLSRIGRIGRIECVGCVGGVKHLCKMYGFDAEIFGQMLNRYPLALPRYPLALPRYPIPTFAIAATDITPFFFV